MGRVGTLFLCFIFVLVLFSGAWAQYYLNSCSDGTPYGKCSSTPGYVCWIDSSSTNGVSLQKVVGSSFTKTFPKCQCNQFPGYIEKDGSCVKTTCDDSGTALSDGQCSATKPKKCAGGTIVSDSNACGCPTGQQMSADQKNCEPRVGCRWGTTTCPTGTGCSYVTTDATDDGTCKDKQGCAYGRPACTSLEDCDKSSNADGVCMPKKGCQYSNPACGSGYRCNTDTQACDKITDSVATVAPNTTKANTANAASGLQCCCLPGAGMAMLAGFVLFRRKEE